MITRSFLIDGHYVASLQGLPTSLRWTQSTIEASLKTTLDVLRHEPEVWLFGYGSLIWNPLVHCVEQQTATLNGWQRRFCQTITVGRGCPQIPGRMLALVPGEYTHGMAYRLAPDAMDDELRVVWTREMAMGTYHPLITTLTLLDGRVVLAVVFVANETHPNHRCSDDEDSIAQSLAHAKGAWGTNAEYLFRLESSLAHHGIPDESITTLANKVRDHQRLAPEQSTRVDRHAA